MLPIFPLSWIYRPGAVHRQNSRKHVVIVGAGFGSIAAGIALLENLGWKDFTIFEKGDRLGRMWDKNSCPGDAYNIPSHVEHVESVIVSKGLLPHIQYRAKIIECVWDDEFEEYDIVVEHSPPSDDNDETAARGAEIERLKAAVVILPSVTSHISNLHPDIPKAGLENFKGDWWHAAQWRHDISLKNKKVGVVGTSCCAVQGFRAINEDDSTQVIHFCRDSTWFVPRNNSATPTWLMWMFAHIPIILFLYRFYICVKVDINNVIASKNEWRREFSTTYIERKVPALEKLTPKHEWGHKCVTCGPEHLDSLRRPNVMVECDPITQIVEDGVITANGTKHELDILVLAGSDLAPCAPIQGLERTLEEHFKLEGGATTYWGVTVPTFPNLFLLPRPNVALGHSSVLFIEQVQANYMAKMIKPILNGKIGSIRVRPEASAAYQQKLKNHARDGCYNQNILDVRDVAMSPGSLTKYWLKMMLPTWSDYETTPGKTTSALS